MPGDVVSFEDSSETSAGKRPWPGGGRAASVRRVKRPLILVVGFLLSGSALAAVISACSSNDTASGLGADEAGTDAGTDRRSLPSEDAEAEVDARAEASVCELTRAYTVECNVGSDAGDPLTCGAAKFDTWCELNDKAINSESYRRAEAMCLSKKNCDGFDRRDCEYRSYLTAKPTNAQKQVVAAYCQTCEPGDTTACIARKTDYDPTVGPKGTDSVFVAAWELNDTLDDQIRTKCTGAALDAGAFDGSADAAPCYKAFDNCAGDIYIGALPDCP